MRLQNSVQRCCRLERQIHTLAVERDNAMGAVADQHDSVFETPTDGPDRAKPPQWRINELFDIVRNHRREVSEVLFKERVDLGS